MPQRLWLQRQRWHHDFINARDYKDELLATGECCSWMIARDVPKLRMIYHAERKYEEDPKRFGYLVRKLRQFLYSFLRRARWRRLIKLVEWERRMELENVARRLDFSEL